MSGIALQWAEDQDAGGFGPKAVLMALANHADEDNKTWISRSSLAAKMQCDVKTIARALKDLEARGLIHREARTRDDGSQASNLILLAVGGLFPTRAEAGEERPTPGAETGREGGVKSPTPGQKVPGGGGIKSLGVGAESPWGGGIKSPLTTFEPTLNQHRNQQQESLRARADATRPGPDAWPEDWWPRFQEAYPHLVRMRATLDLLRRIQAEGETPFAAILDGVAAYIASKPPDRHWLGSDTFLADRRYEDRPVPYRGRDGPLTGQAGRLQELAQSFRDNPDDPARDHQGQRRAYGTRTTRNGAAGVPWTSGDGEEPPPEILLIADRRAYGGRT